MEVIIVYCTFPTKETACQIGTLLIEKQLAACVNLLPKVESIFQWDGKMRYESEVMLIIKTTKGRYHQLEAELLNKHPYDSPEIISTEVSSGAEGYLEWVRDQVKGHH